MATVDNLLKRVNNILAVIEQRQQPKPIMRLPTVYFTDTGEDWPGYEESNALAYKQAAFMGIAVKEYIAIDPREDGSEAA